MNSGPSAPAPPPSRAFRPPASKPAVTVLTGFLGAGKTTLVNHLLSSDHGRRIAVIVNEMGEIGIDSDLIVSSDEEIVEMANGCICCTLTVRSDLAGAVRKLLARPDPPDYFLIETSGMADPAPVAQALFTDELAERVEVDGIVTIVDAYHAGGRLDAPPDGPPPGQSGGQLVDQIVCADRIVVNKVDLVDEDTCRGVEQQIRSLNNTAPLIRSRYAEVDPDQLLGIGAFGRSRPAAAPDFFDAAYAHSHDPGVEAVSLEVGGDLDEEKLSGWLRGLVESRSADIYRLKGIIAAAGRPDQLILQGVHSMYEIYSGGPWPGGPRRTRLVIIGRDFDGAALRSELEGCRA